ncbi:MAG: CDP-glycerol glycerophosphotransferase family protein [Candidatus Nomurabacteria bacterium]|jgi:hypothetical protein|nr:CDP-glycerol glycerophosphotransferase family protein [Candidatus Nomurabacteria bacterium]
MQKPKIRPLLTFRHLVVGLLVLFYAVSLRSTDAFRANFNLSLVTQGIFVAFLLASLIIIWREHVFYFNLLKTNLKPILIWGLPLVILILAAHITWLIPPAVLAVLFVNRTLKELARYLFCDLCLVCGVMVLLAIFGVLPNGSMPAWTSFGLPHFQWSLGFSNPNVPPMWLLGIAMSGGVVFYASRHRKRFVFIMLALTVALFFITGSRAGVLVLLLFLALYAGADPKINRLLSKITPFMATGLVLLCLLFTLAFGYKGNFINDTLSNRPFWWHLRVEYGALPNLIGNAAPNVERYASGALKLPLDGQYMAMWFRYGIIPLAFWCLLYFMGLKRIKSPLVQQMAVVWLLYGVIESPPIVLNLVAPLLFMAVFRLPIALPDEQPSLVPPKIQRAAFYAVWLAKYTAKNSIALAIALFLRKSPKYRNLWLIAELPKEARDNGVALFCYITQHRLGVNVRYVLDRRSPDYAKLPHHELIIQPGSWQHYLAHILCIKAISTHMYGSSPGRYFCRPFLPLMRPKTDYFIQHGVLVGQMPTRGYQGEVFASSASEIPLLEASGLSREHIHLTGMCRYDNLISQPTPRPLLLIMPTYREWLGDSARTVSAADFKKSAYHRHWQGFLNSPELQALTSRWQVIFYPHRQMQGFAGEFSAPNITIGTSDKFCVPDLLRQAKVLITDYSSVLCDFLYMQKPVIAYQFDQKQFYAARGSNERSAIYPAVRVATTKADLAAELQHTTNKPRLTPSEDKVVQNFFAYHDRRNTKRVFDTIKGAKNAKN